ADAWPPHRDLSGDDADFPSGHACGDFNGAGSRGVPLRGSAGLRRERTASRATEASAPRWTASGRLRRALPISLSVLRPPLLWAGTLGLHLTGLLRTLSRLPSLV